MREDTQLAALHDRILRYVTQQQRTKPIGFTSLVVGRGNNSPEIVRRILTTRSTDTAPHLVVAHDTRMLTVITGHLRSGPWPSIVTATLAQLPVTLSRSRLQEHRPSLTVVHARHSDGIMKKAEIAPALQGLAAGASVVLLFRNRGNTSLPASFGNPVHIRDLPE